MTHLVSLYSLSIRHIARFRLVTTIQQLLSPPRVSSLCVVSVNVGDVALSFPARYYILLHITYKVDVISPNDAKMRPIELLHSRACKRPVPGPKSSAVEVTVNVGGIRKRASASAH